jgi:AP-1-like factor
VAELENKSFSSTVENENLLSILKRLQEENVRLKQSAFTFAMPRAGSTSNSSPTDPRVSSPIQQNGSKPPTPPSSTDEPLKSVHEVPPVGLPHRTSSSGMSGLGASPESLKSVGSSNSSRNVFGNSPMRFDSFSNFSTDTGITPPSVSSENKSDFDALWASFYPANGNANGTANTNNQQQAGQVPGNQSGFTQQQYQAALASPNPLSQFLATQMAQGKFQPQDLQPQTQTQPNMAYRDPSAEAPGQDWSAANNTSIDDFLASLNGTNTVDDNPVTSADDDLFNQQLQQMLAGSTFDNTTFSPTNYLNMSPSPLNSLSNSTSPQSGQVSGASYSASPESSNASSAPPKEMSPQYPCAPGQVVNVIDNNGNIVKPSDLWVKMGMQHQDNVDNLLIDDLCDQMRAKAKCHDGQPQLNISDVEHMMNLPKSVAESGEKFKWGAVFSGQHH